MRTLCLAALAAIGGLSLQTAAPASRVVVVIDGDAPAADAPQAARLRDALLQQVDPTASASYFELTADRLMPVPQVDAASFRRAVFTVTPPTYSGLSVTYAESVEVLRGNEPVRDDLVARQCPPVPGECAGRVLAAVTAEVRHTETASARKLRALVANAAGWRGAQVLLFTAGWPTRDDRRVGLERAARDLRERGVALVVVRVPPPTPYRGLVRDASESLAAQVPARFATLTGDADVDQLAALVAEDTAAVPGAAGPPALDAAPASGLLTVPASGTPAATEAAAAVSSDALVASVVDTTLRKAAAYVARFERTFTAVLWHERYEQEDRVWRRFGASGAITSVVAARRTLESELFFAWLPQDSTWISVRDVTTVDGKARPAGDRRLPPVAARATVSLPELRELARENGRFNIGQIVRTFNEPTLALLFLDDRHRARVAFARKGQRRVDGRWLATYTFLERGRPTLIHSERRDVPVRGTVEIDEASGEVRATAIEMSEPASGLTGSMAVDYRPHVAFDVLVPHEMRESYVSANTEQVTATAIYSDFRRFQATGRLILTP